MDTASIWDSLFSLSIGKVAGWLVVIGVIISGICVATIKLYKVFSKYKQLKDEDKRQRDLLLEHDKILKDLQVSINDIKKSTDEQRNFNLKEIRYLLVNSSEEALAAGYISENKLKALEELYEMYKDVFHGNGYVKGLMIRVRQLI